MFFFKPCSLDGKEKNADVSVSHVLKPHKRKVFSIHVHSKPIPYHWLELPKNLGLNTLFLRKKQFSKLECDMFVC